MKNVVITILAILVVALGGYVVYDINNEKNKENCIAPASKENDEVENKENCIAPASKENDEVENKNTDTSKSDVPATDMYALAVDDDSTYAYNIIEFYMLHDGKLYYKFVRNWKDSRDKYIYTFDYDTYNSNTKDLIEYKGLDNIKRIKGTNTISTGLEFNLLLITYDGKVYELDAGYDDGKIYLEEYSPLKDYKVDDILELSAHNGCAPGPGEDVGLYCGSSWKILLQDGSIGTLQNGKFVTE